MKNSNKVLIFLLLTSAFNFVGITNAQNPILPGKGLCDPHIRVSNNNIYLYATHDASINNKDFVMNDWWIWSSDDLVKWRYESTLEPETTYFGKPSSNCWATDAICKNGLYYLYFSMGQTDIGVVVGKSPIGPWSDPLKKPLISNGLTDVEERDPGILIDDDGSVYIVFGVWDFYIAKLNPDMISLAETPRKIILDKKSGPYGNGRTDDKPYLHKHKDNYYLSWGCYYAMSKNLYGPYVNKGSIIVENRVEKEFQKGLTQDRHGSFFQLHNQWYFICNDQSFEGSNGFFRNSVISYLHYRKTGEIEPIYINKTGVGRYDAISEIQAENYFKISGAEKKEALRGGFEIQNLKNGSYLAYPHIFNLSLKNKLALTVSSASAKGGIIEIRNKSINGSLLGSCKVKNTGGWDTYKKIVIDLKSKNKEIDMYLVCKGNKEDFVHIDKFTFE
jgi:arabinoxylan arabinofuranohydrolase